MYIAQHPSCQKSLNANKKVLKRPDPNGAKILKTKKCQNQKEKIDNKN